MQPHLAGASVCSRASKTGPRPANTASTAGGLVRLSGAAGPHAQWYCQARDDRNASMYILHYGDVTTYQAFSCASA